MGNRVVNAAVATPGIALIFSTTSCCIRVTRSGSPTIVDGIEMLGGTRIDVPEVTKPVSNAEINRELTILKRMFSLAIQADKLYRKPHVPLLKEDNVRRGFFDDEQVASVINHLPDPLSDVIRFAYITGWRIPSEVLTLEWRQVDFTAGQVRLDPGSTKNYEGRVFQMTHELRQLLQRRQDAVDELKRTRGLIIRHVFYRMVADTRGGAKTPRPVTAFNKAWAAACLKAGCPDAFHTIYGAAPFGIWFAQESLSELRCR